MPHTPEEGEKIHRLKRCNENNKGAGGAPKSLIQYIVSEI